MFHQAPSTSPCRHPEKIAAFPNSARYTEEAGAANGTSGRKDMCLRKSNRGHIKNTAFYYQPLWLLPFIIQSILSPPIISSPRQGREENNWISYFKNAPPNPVLLFSTFTRWGFKSGCCFLCEASCRKLCFHITALLIDSLRLALLAVLFPYNWFVCARMLCWTPGSAYFYIFPSPWFVYTASCKFGNIWWQEEKKGASVSCSESCRMILRL